jgi:hypothetical protein
LDGITTCWDSEPEHAAVMALTYRAVLRLEREVILGPSVPENALELGYRLAALDFYRSRALLKPALWSTVSIRACDELLTAIGRAFSEDTNTLQPHWCFRRQRPRAG